MTYERFAILRSLESGSVVLVSGERVIMLPGMPKPGDLFVTERNEIEELHRADKLGRNRELEGHGYIFAVGKDEPYCLWECIRVKKEKDSWFSFLARLWRGCPWEMYCL